MIKKKILWFFILAVLGINCYKVDKELLTRSKENLLFKTTEPWLEDSIKVSADNNRFCFTARRFIKNKYVVIDGKKSPIYEGILDGTPLFSPDSKRVAYVAQDGKDKIFAVIDGKKEKFYEGIQYGNPVFSPDSQHYAYPAILNGKWRLIVDGIEIPGLYDSITSVPGFSYDSKHIAFLAQIGDNYLVVKDGVPSNLYGIIPPKFNYFGKKGTKVAFSAFHPKNDKELVVFDGKESRLYDSIMRDTPIFSPDGEHIIYAVKLGEKRFVVVDYTEQKSYDGIGEGTLVFSPDSKRFGYVAIKENKFLIVVDGKESPLYDQILQNTPVFSADSKEFAYAGLLSDGWVVVKNGKESKRYEGVKAIKYAPVGNAIAYIVKQGKNEFIVFNDKELPAYNVIDEESLTFSPDGSKIAYFAKVGRKGFVCVNDQKYESSFKEISDITFSSDSKHVAYLAKVGSSFAVVVDGKAGKAYNKIIENDKKLKLVFSDDNKLIFHSTKGASLYKVEIDFIN